MRRPASLQEWDDEVAFVLPRINLADITGFLALAVASPGRFFRAIQLAIRTRRPGLNGLIYQAFYFAEAMLVAGRIKQIQPDHIHNHFGDHSGLITMLAAILNGIDYSISFHGPHVFIDGTSAAIGDKVAHARFIRCISYFCRSQVIVYSGDADVAKLKIVHCGLDLEKYPFRPRDGKSRAAILPRRDSHPKRALNSCCRRSLFSPPKDNLCTSESPVTARATTRWKNCPHARDFRPRDISGQPDRSSGYAGIVAGRLIRAAEPRRRRAGLTDGSHGRRRAGDRNQHCRNERTRRARP